MAYNTIRHICYFDLSVIVIVLNNHYTRKIKITNVYCSYHLD